MMCVRFRFAVVAVFLVGAVQVFCMFQRVLFILLDLVKSIENMIIFVNR